MAQEDTFSRSIQNYLKVIYALTRDGTAVSTVALAEKLNVKPASVTNMLQKLDEFQPNLVIYHKHHGVLLTADGEREALKIIRRHRLIEQFLYEVLGYSWDQVHPEAEELEHVISPYFEDRLEALLGTPVVDPHGEPIPDRNLQIAVDESISPLVCLLPGQAAVVRRVSAESQEMLAYLDDIGLHPGKRIKLVNRNPIDGTLQVLIGTEECFFGKATADVIFVSPLK